MSLSSSMSDVTVVRRRGSNDHRRAVNHDAVAAVLHKLRGLSWTTAKIATRMKVSEFVVEETLRLGVSSSAMRAQFSAWIHDSHEVPDGLPAALVAAASRQCDGTRSASCSTLDDMDDADGLFDDDDWGRRSEQRVVDDGLRQHFAFLQQTVGYNFMSILNDPTEVDSGRGSWLSNTVNDVLDYGNKPPSTTITSAQLLAQHPITSSSFDTYLQYVGNVMEHRNHALSEYHKWQADVRHMLQSDEGCISSSTRRQVTSSSSDHNLPWPTHLAAEYFAPDFSVSTLIRQVLPIDDSMTTTDLAHLAPMTDSLESLEVACNDIQTSLVRVEHCLFVHVQEHSDDFFSASQSFEDLHHDTEAALSELAAAKEALINKGDTVVSEFTNVARLHRRKGHLKSLGSCMADVLKLVQQWHFVDNWLSTEGRSIEMLPEVTQALLECQKVVFAQSELASLLSDLACTRHIPIQVSQAKSSLTQLITSQGSSALHESLTLSRKGLPVDWALTIASLEASVPMACLPQLLQIHQQAVLDNLWISTRASIYSTYDSQVAVGVAKLAAQVPHPKADRIAFLGPVKALPPTSYMKLMMHILTSVQEEISAVIAHWHVVRDFALDLWERCRAPNEASAEATSPIEVPIVLRDGAFEALLSTAAHHCVMDLLSVRYEENGSMRTKDIAMLVRQCFQFSRHMETIARHSDSETNKRNQTGTRKNGNASNSSTEFRNILTGQCKRVFQKQHEKLQERVLQAVTAEERWEPVEAIDSMFQDMCTDLCSSSDWAVEAFHRLSVDFDARRPADSTRTTDATPSEDLEVPVASTRLFVIDPEEAVQSVHADVTETSHGFVVTHSLLLLLQTLHEYDHLLGLFPFLAFDIVGKLYEALKLYDGQCAAMILGASAVDMGILPSISSQHLALASQCTACLADVATLLQKRLLRLLPSDKLSSFIERDFDRAKREFVAHRDEFLAKVVAVAKERIDTGSAGFISAQWEQRGNAFVMGMLREMAKLLKVIRPILRPIDLRTVFVPIVANATQRLQSAARSVPTHTMQSAEAQILSDIQLFKINTEKFGFLALKCLLVCSRTSIGAVKDDSLVDCVVPVPSSLEPITVAEFQHAILHVA